MGKLVFKVVFNIDSFSLARLPSFILKHVFLTKIKEHFGASSSPPTKEGKFAVAGAWIMMIFRSVS